MVQFSKRSPRTFFKRVASRTTSGKDEGVVGRDVATKKGSVTPEKTTATSTTRSKKVGSAECQRATAYHDPAQSETGASEEDEAAPRTENSPLGGEQKEEQRRKETSASAEQGRPNKKANPVIKNAKSAATTAGGRSSSKMTQRKPKENGRRANSSRGRAGRAQEERPGKSRAKEKRASSAAVTRSSSNGRAARGKETIKVQDVTAGFANITRNSSSRRRKQQDEQQSDDIPLQGEEGKDADSPHHSKKGEGKELHKTQPNLLKHQHNSAKNETDGREDKAMASEEAATAFLLSSIEALEDAGEGQHEREIQYRRLIEAFDSYQQSAGVPKTQEGSDLSRHADALASQIFVNDSSPLTTRKTDVLKGVKRAIYLGGRSGVRAAQSLSKQQAQQTKSDRGAKGSIKKCSQSQSRTSSRPPKQNESHVCDVQLSTSPSPVGLGKHIVCRPNPNGDASSGDENGTVVTLQTEGDFSVEVSRVPDDESSTVVHLFSGDKYDMQARHERQHDPASPGSKEHAKLHSAWRDNAASPEGMGALGNDGPVGLKTVRFDRDGPEVAWDLDFFPTQGLKDDNTKKRKERKKQEEEEERRRRMELWETSTGGSGGQKSQPRHFGRRGRGKLAPPPPTPSATMSVESSMGSSFAASEGVRSTAASSITCSIYSRNSSSLASSALTEDISEPSLDFRKKNQKRCTMSSPVKETQQTTNNSL